MSRVLADDGVAPAPSVAALPDALAIPARPTLFLALVCCVLAALVTLPFVVGDLGAPHSFVFRGTLKPSGDESQYLAAVRMGLGGDWLWHDPYMAMPPGPILMYPVYLAAGHLAGLSGLGVRAGFALLHLLAALILCMALWRLAAEALPRADRPWLVIIALGAGGPYWLVALLATAGREPISLTQMGSDGLSGFTALLMEAHVALGTAGQLLVFAGLLGALRREVRARVPSLLCGSGGMLLVGLSLPVLLPLTLAVSALVAAWWLAQHRISARPRRAVRHVLLSTGIIAMPGLALVVYYARLFGSGPWAAGQFRSVPAIPPIEEASLWGILVPLAAWGWWRAGQAARPAANALAIWACGAVLGTQLPLWQGSRLTAGMAVALGSLFALGLLSATPNRPTRVRWTAVLCLGPLCQYLYLLSALAGGHSPYLYGSAAEDRAARWLASHAGQGDVVLAPFGFANVLPTVAPVRVVAGHTYQTLDLARRLPEIAAFFGAGSSTPARLRALRATAATVVVYDRLDAENGPFDPRGLAGLSVALSTPDVVILRLPRSFEWQR